MEKIKIPFCIWHKKTKMKLIEKNKRGEDMWGNKVVYDSYKCSKCEGHYFIDYKEKRK